MFLCPLIAEVIVTQSQISRVPYEGTNPFLELLSLPKRYSFKLQGRDYFCLHLHDLTSVGREEALGNATDAVLVFGEDEVYFLLNMSEEFFELLEPTAGAVGRPAVHRTWLLAVVRRPFLSSVSLALVSRFLMRRIPSGVVERCKSGRRAITGIRFCLKFFRKAERGR